MNYGARQKMRIFENVRIERGDSNAPESSDNIVVRELSRNGFRNDLGKVAVFHGLFRMNRHPIVAHGIDCFIKWTEYHSIERLQFMRVVRRKWEYDDFLLFAKV